MRLDTNDPVEVKRFVKELGAAITKDMAEIRETELDRSGCFRQARLEFTDRSLDSDKCDVFVDRLGRVVTPNGEPWTLLETVLFENETGVRGVVKREPRYEGDRVVALVTYLEAKQGDSDA